MNDVVKFRAWDGIGWRYENIFVAFDGVIYFRDPKDLFRRLMKKTEWKVVFAVQQKDKSGKDIYDGDVVSMNRHGFVLNGFVSSDSEGFIVESIENDELENYNKFREGMTSNATPFYTYEGSNFGWDELEVIGNIYENPELLANQRERV